MKFRTKVLSCVVLMALFAYQGLRNGNFSILSSSSDGSARLLPGEHVLDMGSMAFFPPPNSTKLVCVPWSINADDWWAHEPEWEIAEENEHFTCFRKAAKQIADVWENIYGNQFRNSDGCSSTYTRHMWSSGFGTDMENVVLGIQVARMDKHSPLSTTLIGPKPWWHYSANKNDGSNATCPAKDMSCYFLPLTNCTPNERQVDKNPITLIRKYNKDYMAVYNYVTRPQQWLRKEIHDVARPMEIKLTARANTGTSCTVVHVRRADVVLHGSQARKYFSMADYVKLLPQRTSGKHTVLLLTDDANAIDEALEFHADAANWVYFERPRHRGTAGGWEEQVPSRDPKQEVVTILATLKLVQRCDTLIHSRSKFADALSRAMGPNVTLLQVDREMGGSVLDANNSASEQQLAELLEEKRVSQKRNPN